MVDGYGLGARPAGLVAGSKAGHEWTGVGQSEAVVEQPADLLDQEDVLLLVLAIAVARTPGRQEALLFVVAQCASADAGSLGQFPDAHAGPPCRVPTVQLDAGVKVKPVREQRREALFPSAVDG